MFLGQIPISKICFEVVQLTTLKGSPQTLKKKNNF